MLADKLYDRCSNDSWSFNSSPLYGSKTMPLSNIALTELRLLSLALKFSDTANVVYLAPSPWLDAALRVVQGMQSLPLDSHQWQLESFKLFKVSLARMQTDLLHMARDERLHLLIFDYDLLNDSLMWHDQDAYRWDEKCQHHRTLRNVGNCNVFVGHDHRHWGYDSTCVAHW